VVDPDHDAGQPGEPGQVFQVAAGAGGCTGHSATVTRGRAASALSRGVFDIRDQAEFLDQRQPVGGREYVGRSWARPVGSLTGRNTSLTVQLCLAQDTDADQLLTENPFALLVGLLLDQQVPN
jgi:hypothetical protein